MYKKKGYDAFLFICALICDKRLIPCFSRCDVLASTPHSKNTPYNRFSSNYHRKLYFIICTILRAHLRNQKLSMQRISSKYPRKLILYICGLQSTSATHFSYSSKCRRTSLRKTYHRVFDFVKSKSTG